MSSNQMFPGWSASRKLLTSRWILCRAIAFESGKIQWENWQFWLFSFKNKNGAPRETFYSSCRSKRKSENSLWKNTPKTLNIPQGLLYACISTLILLINLFCFRNCGLFCLCYITKHLMTALSVNMFCFPSNLTSNLTTRFSGNKTKQTFPSWAVKGI
mgnify:CR=1 FL=1